MQASGADLGAILLEEHEQAEPTVRPEVFLRRLRRLLVLRYQASNYLDIDDVRLLDHCIFATFCDCLAMGVEEPARRFLDEARAAQIRAGA